MPNSTSGGTPLATQNAPVQSMPRSSPAGAAVAAPTLPAVLLTGGTRWRRAQK
jgi:hypothetical protein